MPKPTIKNINIVFDVLLEKNEIHPSNRDSIVNYLTEPPSKYGSTFREYRFCGSLGFGGKLRWHNNDVPYVDCYKEDETPERNLKIKTINEILSKKFGI